MRVLKNFLMVLFITSALMACEELLEVPDISEQQVELLAPTDQSVVNDSIVNLNWNDIFDADAFLVQVATPSFEAANQMVLDTTLVIDSTFVGTRISKTFSDNDYEWRVKALNSAFETEFSNSRFTVDTSGE
jgi:hypothetical protein